MEAEQIRGTLRNAGFTDAQIEGLTAVLADLATKDDIRELRTELRTELHREISNIWRNIALTMLAQTLVIIGSLTGVVLAVV